MSLSFVSSLDNSSNFILTNFAFLVKK